MVENLSRRFVVTQCKTSILRRSVALFRRKGTDENLFLKTIQNTEKGF